MNYNLLLKRLTQLCGEMLAAGGYSEAMPYKMNYICDKYGLKESEFIIYPSSVLATAIAPDGTEITSVRSIENIGQNFGRLHAFDNYCETIIETLPSADEIEAEIAKIKKDLVPSKAQDYLGAILVGVGFATVFGAGIFDVIATIIACAVVVVIGGKSKRVSYNMFVYNAVVCFVLEFAILLSASAGICKHPESITLGVMMLLISGLNFNDGLWSLMSKDTYTGLYKLSNSVIGAIGILAGIVPPLVIMNSVEIKGLTLHSSLLVQIIMSGVACAGFAVINCLKTRYVIAIAVGGGITWLVYSVVNLICPSVFIAMAAGTFVETLYALFISYRMGIAPNIIHTIGMLTLVPGSNLFYTLYGIVSGNSKMEHTQFVALIVTCLGISFGFTIGRLFYDESVYKIKENASK